MTDAAGLSDTQAMRLALEEADAAAEAGEVPVGCVILDPAGRPLAAGQNRRERDEDPTAHAEVVALRTAGQTLGTWRLIECTLVVTLEPCPMCAGAIVNARIARLVFGASDPKAGAAGTLLQLCADPRLNHQVEIHPGVLAKDCADRLRSFFKQQRALGKK
ncbi:MAG: tRNA adenosine(34) deaminase TadA [Planctomycetota bacterium]